MGARAKSWQLPYSNAGGKRLTLYGLSSRNRPPPISDHLGLTICEVAHGRVNFIKTLEYTLSA